MRQTLQLGAVLDDDVIAVQDYDRQTMRLVNSELSTLQARLRNVSIPDHWLR